MTQEEKQAGLKELKARAYDAIAGRDHFDRELARLNKEIEILSKKLMQPVEDNADVLNA